MKTRGGRKLWQMPLVLTSPRCLLLYRLRTSWLHQHLFFFFYTLVVIINCWLLSLVLRCYLSREGTWKSLSGDVKLLSYGLLNVSWQDRSPQNTAGSACPAITRAGCPNCGWGGEGRWGEQRRRWGGQGRHCNNVCCVLFLMKLPHFHLQKNARLPLSPCV